MRGFAHVAAVALLLAAASVPVSPTARAQMIEESWSADGLHGAIAKPAAHARGPAVLIIAGSGPTDRNGNGPGSPPQLFTDTYRHLARELADNGILSLRYDKRGIAESRGLVKREDDLVFETFTADAIAALQSLRSRPDVSSVLIAGHSEGGLIALAAASRVPVAGLILLATPGRTYLTVMRGQLKGRLPPDLDASANAIMDALSAGKRVDDPPKQLMALFRPSVQPFLISIGNFDPAGALAQSKVPALIVHAGRDLQVSAVDFDALRSARSDAKTLILAEANHTLKTSPADREGNLALYQNPSAPLDAGLMPALVAFVRSAAR
jgi:pimeloyl-ACP methyl ester carboxylesterase